MNSNALLALSEIELVKLYREEQRQTEKTKIFKSILFVPRNNKSWHQYILNHAEENIYRAGFCNIILDVDDLYQEIVYAFLKLVESWFDIKSASASFPTYAWYVINSYTGRVFQSSNTHKRRINPKMIIEINSVCNDNESKKFGEVISDQNNIGMIRTIEKGENFEDMIFHKNLVEFLLKFFEPEEINAPDSLKNELTSLIKNKYDSKQNLSHLAIKYETTLQSLGDLTKQITENIKRQIFRDIIIFIKKDIKSDDILAEKYNCSTGHVLEMKKELPVILKKKFNEVNFNIHNYCY